MTQTLALIACLTSSLALAQTVPGSITFNARLTDVGGAAVTGSHALGFALYDTGSGGAALWTENVSGANFSTEGVTFVELGAVTPLTTSALDGRKLYLEVSVDGTTLTPRLTIVSVPYAIRASVAATALTIGSLTESAIQRRITGTCNPGQAVRSVDASGGVQCENLATGDITAVTTAAGSGLTGGSASGDVALSLTTCAAGEVLKSTGSGWGCSASTAVTTTGGLTVTGGSVGLQTCATGEILRHNGSTWTCALITTSGANGRNLFTFDSTVANWGTPTFTGAPFSITTNVNDSQEGEAAFDFAYGDVAASTGIVAVWGSDFIQVDPSKTYEGAIKARSASGTYIGSFWAGFIAYSSSKTPLQGPSSIFLSGPTRCVPFIANAVPNTSMSPTWQQFVGRVQGEGAGNNTFPVGTRYIKPCVGTNLSGIGTTRLDSFEIYEIASSPYNSRVIRYAQWSSYDQAYGWLGVGGNGDPAMFGGVTPQLWGDGSGTTSQMSPDAEMMRTLFNKKLYPGANAMIAADVWYNYSSTNSRHTGVLMRIKNTNTTATTLPLTFYATCRTDWGEYASASVNGANSWTCPGNTGGKVTTSVNFSIPPGRTSTLIMVAGSDVDTGYRSNFLAFTNNSLALPTGLTFVDDLDVLNGSVWTQ